MNNHRPPLPEQDFVITDHAKAPRIDLKGIIEEKYQKGEYADDLRATYHYLHSAKNRSYEQWIYDIEDEDDFDEDDFDEDDPDIRYTDWLDIDYTVDYNGNYQSVRLALSLGGPNTYLDTGDGCFHVYWWGEHYSVEISPDIIRQIDDHFEQYYDDCVKHL